MVPVYYKVDFLASFRSGRQLRFGGSMYNRINIHATNEVFKTTKERVTQAELDNKKVR